MQIRPLPVDDDALRRFARELWLPYHRDLADAVPSHALADRPDEEIVEANVAFYREQLTDAETPRWGWVAADHPDDDPTDVPFTDPDLAFGGFLLASVDEAPDVFDRPDRLLIGDLYVREPSRGTGLARRLVERAATDARERDCPELCLDVDASNERALAFYEKVGFAEHRKRMTLPADEV